MGIFAKQKISRLESREIEHASHQTSLLADIELKGKKEAEMKGTVEDMRNLLQQKEEEIQAFQSKMEENDMLIMELGKREIENVSYQRTLLEKIEFKEAEMKDMVKRVQLLFQQQEEENESYRKEVVDLRLENQKLIEENAEYRLRLNPVRSSSSNSDVPTEPYTPGAHSFELLPIDENRVHSTTPYRQFNLKDIF